MTTTVKVLVSGNHNVHVSLQDRQAGESGADKWKASSDSFDLKPGEESTVTITATRRLQVEEYSEAGRSSSDQTGRGAGVR